MGEKRLHERRKTTQQRREGEKIGERATESGVSLLGKG